MDAAVAVRIRRRAGNRCEYCLLPQEASSLSFHVEHIVARQHRGGDDDSNLCLACDRCNLNKGPNLTSIDPVSRRVVRLFHPRRNQWSEHFQCRGPRIEGISPCGRATVELLCMNDLRRVKLRERLMEEGLFPLEMRPEEERGKRLEE